MRLFVIKRNLFYNYKPLNLFDPYGIYAYGDCYPAKVDGGSKMGVPGIP
ncbi:MAG: hypothetical protein ABR502_06655 [Chitinophagaceae bacterium]